MTLRLVRASDAAAVLSIYAPYCATPISFEDPPPDVVEIERRILASWPAYPWLVAEEEGQLLGYTYACRHRERAAYRWTVETSVYLAPAAQGRGLGKRLYIRLFEILRRQGYHTALAGITLPNDKSVGLHRKMGFEPCAVYRQIGYKGGEWRDVQWLELHLDSNNHPTEPMPLDELDLDFTPPQSR